MPWYYIKMKQICRVRFDFDITGVTASAEHDAPVETLFMRPFHGVQEAYEAAFRKSGADTTDRSGDALRRLYIALGTQDEAKITRDKENGRHNMDTIAQELPKKEYLECEKYWVFLLLMLSAGYWGGFTYSIRGGVFCNAQTGNCIRFGLALGNLDWSEACYYLIPIVSYFFGTLCSVQIARSIKKLRLIRWDTLLVALEMVCVVFLALLPESAPFQITHILINFLCAMQYNTFRQAEGIPMATTFCTNHTRQAAVALDRFLARKNKAAGKAMLRHLEMIGIFVVGVAAAAAMSRNFQGKALLLSLIPLGIVFCDLLYADLKSEKGLLQQIPKGH